MSKTIVTLLHAFFEKPGYISNWAEQNDFEIEEIHCWKSPEYPDPKDVKRLLIMGGPMGVYEAKDYLWMLDEIRFIRAVIDAGNNVLGICLGSQLISAAMGAKVYPNDQPEIGWFEVRWNEAAYKHPLTYGVSSHSKVFHYHGDTFDLPEDAVLLASSKGCKHQAYALGNNVLALQFHMEVNHELLEDMLFHGDELVPDTFVQSKKQIQDGIYDVMQNHTDLGTLLENIYCS
jgi:GMP synthase-like glutamine amidotransferase